MLLYRIGQEGVAGRLLVGIYMSLCINFALFFPIVYQPYRCETCQRMTSVCVCISNFMMRAHLPLESSSLGKGLPDVPIVRPAPRPCTMTPQEPNCTELKWKTAKLQFLLIQSLLFYVTKNNAICNPVNWFHNSLMGYHLQFGKHYPVFTVLLCCSTYLRTESCLSASC